jgi:hypothetical protein
LIEIARGEKMTNRFVHQVTYSTPTKAAGTGMQRGARWIAVPLLLAAISFLPAATAQTKVSSPGLAPTPPMGWANWNSLGCNYDESTIRAMADHMISSGMKGAGYNYLIIQECIVPTGHRDADGTLVPDPKKFPHGIPALVDYTPEGAEGWYLYRRRSTDLRGLRRQLPA